MKAALRVSLIATLVLFTGCGSLRINPRSCKTKAVWGSNPLSTREITREEIEEEKTLELKAKEQFFVFYDRDLRLRDLLEEHGIKCEEVKKLRVEVTTSWFFLREISLKVVKN